MKKIYFLIMLGISLMCSCSKPELALSEPVIVDKEPTTDLKLIIVSGNEQTGVQDAALFDFFVVKLVDRDNKPVADSIVEFKNLGPNTILSAVQGITDAQGEVKVKLVIAKLAQGIHKVVSVNLKSYPKTSVDFSVNIVDGTIVDFWLTKHLKVADAIIWPMSQKTNLSYKDWDAAQKAELYSYYLKAKKYWEMTVVPTPIVPKNQVQSQYTQFVKQDAWSIYLDNVATSLHLEIERLLGWSILDYDDAKLKMLFDGNQFFNVAVNNLQNYALVNPESNTLWTMVQEGTYLRGFLKQNKMIKDTRKATILALLKWSQNLSHFTGGFTLDNTINHWGYAGIVPPSRMINGTTRESDNKFAHYTAGCHGTSRFLKIVLRTVNIPVMGLRSQNHHQSNFVTEGLYLCHGDDPYDLHTWITPEVSLEDLLIDEETYKKWYNGTTDKPVNMAALDFGVTRLSNILVYERSLEPVNTPHGSSRIYNRLKEYYTVEELEARDLWNRLDAKIEALGGRSKIPQVLIGRYK